MGRLETSNEGDQGDQPMLEEDQANCRLTQIREELGFVAQIQHPSGDQGRGLRGYPALVEELKGPRAD